MTAFLRIHFNYVEICIQINFKLKNKSRRSDPRLVDFLELQES